MTTAASIPAKIPTPFASSGGKNTIPATAASPAASWQTGYPPATRTPIASGGTPPDGLDENGVLFAMSSWDQWFSMGGPIFWDSSFSTTIGGYPKGAMVQGTTPGIFYVNTTDNNTANPVSGGSNWVTLQSIIGTNLAMTGNPTAPTQPAGNNSTRVATTAYADASSAAAGAAAVTSANAFTSAALAAYLPLSGGAITGTVTAPTQAVNNNSTRLATTAYADRAATNAQSAAISSANSYTDTQLSNYAPLVGATFTGSVRGLTASTGDNSTLFATTAFVKANLGSYLPLTGGTLTGNLTITGTGANIFILDATAGQQRIIEITTANVLRWRDTVTGAESGGNSGADRTLNAYADNGALLGSVYSITRSTQVMAFTQSPTAPSPSITDNSTNVATTAYVRAFAAANYLNLAGGTLTGSLIAKGNLTVGDGSGAQNINIDGGAGAARILYYKTNGSFRWARFINSTAESGGNAGSDEVNQAYNDTGGLLGTVYTTNRATQVRTYTQTPKFPTKGVSDNSTNGATTAYADRAAGNALTSAESYADTVSNTALTNAKAYTDNIRVYGGVNSLTYKVRNNTPWSPGATVAGSVIGQSGTWRTLSNDGYFQSTSTDFGALFVRIA